MDQVYRGKSFGLPPPQFRNMNFRSGLTQEEMEVITSDYDDDTSFGSGRYSADSSPQHEEFHQVPRGRYGAKNSRAMPPVYGGSREPFVHQPLNGVISHNQKQSGSRDIRSNNGGGRYQDSVVDGYSDSSGSFEDVGNARNRMRGGDSGMEHSTSGGGRSYDDYAQQVVKNPKRDEASDFLKIPQQDKTTAFSRQSLYPSLGNQNGSVIKQVPDNEMPSAPPIDNPEAESVGSGVEYTSACNPTSSQKTGIVDGDVDSKWKQRDMFNTNCNTGVGGHCNTDYPFDQRMKSTTSNVEDQLSDPWKQPLASSSGLPSFQLSGQGAWPALIAYEACVRLCLRSWASGCMEAPGFLDNECIVLRSAFGLQQMLLQPEEELFRKRSSEAAPEGSAVPKQKKIVGKFKVQVRKVRLFPDEPTTCMFLNMRPTSVKLESIRTRTSNLQSTVLSGWEAVKRIRVSPRPPLHATYSQRGLAYMQASAHYVRQVSSVLKTGVVSLRSSSTNEVPQETYFCVLRLKSSVEEEAFRVQPGSSETHVFLPESLGDDLIIEVQDSKGNSQGRALVQIASLSEDSTEKTRWWAIFKEPEHENVGKLQLFVSYITSPDEIGGAMKCGTVAETVAYDLVLEVAMRMQHFQKRNLKIHGPWKWLLTEFASYYGVSESYTKLRYLSSIMDVASPTEDCLVLIYDLLSSVISARDANALSRQEKRILGDVEEQVDHLLALVFENYKSLDDSSPSGLVDVFGPAKGVAPKALAPAVKIYTLLHDILSPEVQLSLCGYFQTAAKKRSKRHMAETEEYVTNNTEGMLMDALTVSTAYLKVKSLCSNIRNEVRTDIEIHNQHILPSSIDLQNISAAIYNTDLCNRLRSFLVACPPSGPSPPVVELVIATADFQRDIISWNINPVKGGIDAKDLFHLYIMLWIEDKRVQLLELCKPDKVRSNNATSQHITSAFVEEMYERIKESLNEYEIIVCRWPEYTFALETAIAEVDKAVVEALERQFAEVLAPLKDSMIPKKFGLQYVQKLTKRGSTSLYNVPNQLGVFLNTIKRMLDILRPKIELQLKSWVSCLPEGACGNIIFGERVGEITVMLRARFKNTMQAVIEKLADNTRVQRATKIKNIIQDTKEAGGEAEVRERMQPLNSQLVEAISHLHGILASRVFVAICRGFWDRMGQDVLLFLENRKENRSWYRGARITVGILDDTFASQMQRLQGNALQEKDLEPPRSVVEVRSMLCKDTANGVDGSNYYF